VFRKAGDEGKKHVEISQLSEHLEGLELGSMLQALNSEGVQKGIIFIDSNLIGPTPCSIQKCKDFQESFDWYVRSVFISFLLIVSCFSHR
jgi:hypothetical protein